MPGTCTLVVGSTLESGSAYRQPLAVPYGSLPARVSRLVKYVRTAGRGRDTGRMRLHVSVDENEHVSVLGAIDCGLGAEPGIFWINRDDPSEEERAELQTAFDEESEQ
jgi:hypothetical protein